MKKLFVIFIFVLSLHFPVFAGMYDVVDLRAKTVPSEYEKNLNKLVDYLTKPYKGNDELKIRSIFAWIVYHIDYDGYKANEIIGTSDKRRRGRVLNSGDAFLTRVGVCGDIADLFLKMANRADIQVERINGHAGYNLTLDNFESSPHAWNAVRLQNKWYFIDATWAMKGNYYVFADFKNAREHKEAITLRRKTKEWPAVHPSRSIDDFWFLTPPEEMIKTHFPERSKWQYLDNPIKVRDVFRENSKKKERVS